jgi:glycosyltransferase involved in cell wall biosynthesis
VQHPTYYLHLANFKAKRRVPVVLTVYDFIHERFGEQLDPTGAFAALKRRAIEAADAVICISHATKVDLHTFCTVPDERVHVVPLASELNVSMATGDEPLPTRPYFLCVGGRAGYKNFDALLRVFARTLSKRDVALCVAGAPLSPAEAEQIATLHLSERVEVMPYPSDAHLARLYAQSLAFVHPSLYEGFGLPLLEAMACGAPVIAADNSSVPEVVGDEALLFPSGDADALAERLLAVFEGQVERATLVQRGFERAAGFSWERTAAQTVEVYRGLGG